MATAEFVLTEMKNRYNLREVEDFYLRVYERAEPNLQSAFAHFHGRLNALFREMNYRIPTQYFKADDSRELIEIARELGQFRADLRRVAMPVTLDAGYENALNASKVFLRPSNGSEIPEDFQPIELTEYDPIFGIESVSPTVSKEVRTTVPKHIGEGSYALVYKYKDHDYGFQVALKKAKRHLKDPELERFRAEFDLLSRLNHPYILTVYSFDKTGHSYTMEYCEKNLRDYMSGVNNAIPFWARKRMAQQFLSGLTYLSDKGILHRDLSLTNVLVKEYDAGLVALKISDFGLYKDKEVDRTRTGTEIKGSLIDPAIENYKDYALVNEIYSIGHILAFILTGRRNLSGLTPEELTIVHKCTNPDVAARYQSIAPIMTAVSNLSRPSPSPVMQGQGRGRS